MGIEDFISIRRWNRLWPRIKEYIRSMISSAISPSSEKEVISVLTYSDSAPSSPSADDYYINSDENKLYKYIDSTWVEQEASKDCLYVTEDSQKVYAYIDNEFTDVTGVAIDNTITITDRSQLNDYKERGSYTVMHVGDSYTHVYTLTINHGYSGSNLIVEQCLRTSDEYSKRAYNSALEEWTNWSSKSYAFRSGTPTSGNLTAWNYTMLVDSGKKASDFANATHTHAQSDITDLSTDLASKMSKVNGATAGNFASFASDGSVQDSTKKASDFAEKIPKQAFTSGTTETINPEVLYYTPAARGTDLTISFATLTDASTMVHEFHFIIIVGSGTVTLNNNDLVWNGGDGPSWESGHTYEISIMDNVGTFIEIEPATT